jgi:copper chaperone CopZ
MATLFDGSQTTFAVPLHCDSCVKDVSGALGKLNGLLELLDMQATISV